MYHGECRCESVSVSGRDASTSPMLLTSGAHVRNIARQDSSESITTVDQAVVRVNTCLYRCGLKWSDNMRAWSGTFEMSDRDRRTVSLCIKGATHMCVLLV